MPYSFEWDKDKAQSNWIKHAVSLDEATTVFDDPLARVLNDEAHSTEEKREIIIEHSINNQLLVVCFAERPVREFESSAALAHAERTKSL